MLLYLYKQSSSTALRYTFNHRHYPRHSRTPAEIFTGGGGQGVYYTYIYI